MPCRTKRLGFVKPMTVNVRFQDCTVSASTAWLLSVEDLESWYVYAVQALLTVDNEVEVSVDDIQIQVSVQDVKDNSSICRCRGACRSKVHLEWNK